jgi:hypothetical protein
MIKWFLKNTNSGHFLFVLIFFLLPVTLKCQYNLQYFLKNGFENSLTIKQNSNSILINDLQKKLDYSQNSGFQISLTGNYLFAPFFNNNGKLLSVNPDPNAIGYDVGITNGGLYAAQINVSKNILNSPLLNLLDEQNQIQEKTFNSNIQLEKHNLEKQITDLYLTSLEYSLQIDFSGELLDLMNNQSRLLKNLSENGYIKKQDYQLFNIEIKNQLLVLEEQQESYRNNLYQLFTLCGIRDTQVVKLEKTDLSLKKPTQGSFFVNKLISDSSNNLIHQKIFESKYNPQVELFFNTGLNAVEFKDMQKKFGLSAGLNFSLPLFDGNQKSITRQQSLLNQKSITEERNILENNITMQRTNSKNRINVLAKKTKILEEQIEEYKTLISNSEEQVRKGNMSMIDYLTLLKTFIEIKRNFIVSSIDHQIEINNYNYWNW